MFIKFTISLFFTDFCTKYYSYCIFSSVDRHIFILIHHLVFHNYILFCGVTIFISKFIWCWNDKTFWNTYCMRARGNVCRCWLESISCCSDSMWTIQTNSTLIILTKTFIQGGVEFVSDVSLRRFVWSRLLLLPFLCSAFHCLLYFTFHDLLWYTSS